MDEGEFELRCLRQQVLWRYGRLYNWATAMGLPSKCNSVLSTSDPECAINTPHHRGICPSGWHVPSNAEWEALYRHADSEYVPDYENIYSGIEAGGKLMATSGWNRGDIGTDDFGFAALPGGIGNPNGFFYEAGGRGIWWSTSPCLRAHC